MTKYFSDLKAKWKKIIWPSKPVLRNKTIQVIVISAILGCLISMFDYIFQSGLNWLIGVL